MTADALVHLGQLLSSAEASKLAARLEDGATLSGAVLAAVPSSRRTEVQNALANAGLSADPELAIHVLRGIQGAAIRTTQISPIWTLPGHLVGYGSLTTSIRELVLSAKQSVMCSTFNFQRSSGLWQALREVSWRGSVEVRVYLDTGASTRTNWQSTPTSEEVARQLAGAKVFRTVEIDGRLVTNHAKFVAVDHQFLVVTSANYSLSAEHNNVELGLRVQSRALTETVERQILDIESSLYERVSARDQ